MRFASTVAVLALTLLAKSASPEEQALWRPRIDATVSDLRDASLNSLRTNTAPVFLPTRRPRNSFLARRRMRAPLFVPG